MSNFSERLNKVRQEADAREQDKAADTRKYLEKQMERVVISIEQEHKLGKRSLTLSTYGVDAETLESLRKVGYHVTPIASYNPSTHDDWVTGWTIKW